MTAGRARLVPDARFVNLRRYHGGQQEVHSFNGKSRFSVDWGEMANSRSGESVLTRVMRVIEAFSESSPMLSVSEISQRADLPIATTHRIVGDLVAERVLVRDAQRKIALGTRLWEISQRSSHEMSLRTAALPVMTDLQSVVQSHVQLAVVNNGQVLYLERLSRPRAVGNLAHPASRLPLYLCSSGLVLLAHAPREVQEKVISEPLIRKSTESIRTGEELRTVLATTRQRGYSVADRLIQPISKGVAVPIFGEGGRVVAALSVVLPTEDDHRPVLPAMQTSARIISRLLTDRTEEPHNVWGSLASSDNR